MWKHGEYNGFSWCIKVFDEVGSMYVTSDIGRAVLLAVRVPDDDTTANKII